MLSHYKNKKQKNEAKVCYCTEEDTLVVFKKLTSPLPTTFVPFQTNFVLPIKFVYLDFVLNKTQMEGSAA